MAEYDSGDGRWSVKPVTLPTLNFHQFDPHIHASTGANNHGMPVVEMHTHEPGTNGSRTMGSLEWNKDSGEIWRVSTKGDYRRMGVANELFHAARKMAREQGFAEPAHSDDRSDMGDAWAKQAGGEVPPRYRKPAKE